MGTIKYKKDSKLFDGITAIYLDRIDRYGDCDIEITDIIPVIRKHYADQLREIRKGLQPAAEFNGNAVNK